MADPIPFPAKSRDAGALASREVSLAAAPRVARICALALGLDELLGEVCKEILALSGTEGCYLVACHEDAARNEIWHSTLPGEWPDLRSAYRRSVHLGGVLERLRAAGALAVEDCDRLPADDPLRLLYAPQPVRAALLFPLKFGTRLLGVLSLHMYSGAKGWREEDVRALSEVVVPVLSAALERRRMEARLRVSEARYRFLADHALDFISLHDSSGRYLYASPAARGMLGYRPEEMMGVAAAAFLHPDDQEKFREENRRLVSGEILAMTLHCRLRRKDGGFMEVETVSSAVLNERGEVRQVLRVTRDITERKKMESRLFESQKLETIGMLAGGVAHEFNNLLVGINGAVEMLGLLLTGNWEARNYLAMIERNGERAVELTRQLLAYARQGKYSPRIVLLNRAVLEDVPILKAALPASVELRLELAEEIPPVLADITQLKQVVMSLCLNAGEAMANGGILTIRTRSEAGPHAAPWEWGRTGGGGAARRLRSGDPLSGPLAVLEVSDMGCGMDGKTIGRIFEPFFSTKFIGRGMGLAAVRGIVESHDGEILVCSEPGRGTTISIGFPAAAGTPAEVETPEAPLPIGAGTILVADDEEDVREVVGAMLGSFGYRVIGARDGMEAVDLFRGRHREIDLVLLDLMMPRMTGDLAYAEMRRIFPGVRALLASGYDETDRVREIVAGGFKGFIQKPFRRTELGQKVEEVLGNKGRHEGPDQA
ncbi:MAG: PAS domain S-box protein [Deltaproteobacteria bacterium]|nr:PAS domain S-box protein [Deltaproteobacteria bacterium]